MARSKRCCTRWGRRACWTTSSRSSCSCRRAQLLLCPLRRRRSTTPTLQAAGAVQDAANPDFVAEVVELYFEDSAGKVEKLAAKLAAPAPDFNEVDQLVHQFKGSSASFGAQAIAALCVQARPRRRLLAPLGKCPSSCRPLQGALESRLLAGVHVYTKRTPLLPVWCCTCRGSLSPSPLLECTA